MSTIKNLATKPVKGHTIDEKRARQIAFEWTYPGQELHEFAKGADLKKTEATEYLNTVLLAMQPEGFSLSGEPRTAKELSNLSALLQYLKKEIEKLKVKIEYGKNTHYGYWMAIETDLGNFNIPPAPFPMA